MKCIPGFTVACSLFVTLSCTALCADDLGGGDKSAKSPVIDQGNQIWTQPLLGGGVKSSDVYTDGNLFITAPLWSTIGKNGVLGGDYMFLEPYTSLGERGEVATSLGLSWRHLFSNESVAALKKQGRASFMEEGWFLGGNLFVDMLDTQHNNNFWQLGVGAEAGTRYFEMRGNYYIPLTGEKLYERDVNTQSFTSSSTSQSTQNTFGDPFAAGNSIQQPFSSQTLATTTTRTTTLRTITELFEKGMRGWDAEASVLVPWVDQWMDLRFTGGYLSFDNQPFGPQNRPTGSVHGWKAGAELRPVPAVVLGGAWYEDKRFAGSNWVASMELQIPMDHTWRDAFTMRRRHLVEHLAEPVHRQNDAIKTGNREDQQTTASTSVQHVTRVVSQTATHLVLRDDIIFVNNGGPVGNGIQAGSPTGNGTAERPVSTIQFGADLATANNLTTSRVWNVYTQQSSLGAYAENVAITGSANFISSGALIPALGGHAFGTGVRPVLNGTFFTQSSVAIQSVGITAYDIRAASQSAAITTNNVHKLLIQSNLITNSLGDGIDITESNGKFAIARVLGNQIINTGENAMEVTAQQNATLTFTAKNNIITGAGGDGIVFEASGANTYLSAGLFSNNISGSVNGSGVSVFASKLSTVDLGFFKNAFFGNNSNGLSLNFDEGSSGTLTARNNLFDGNGRNGLSLFTDRDAVFSGFFAGNHFDSNLAAGFTVLMDRGSQVGFESFHDTFNQNGLFGMHVDAQNFAGLLPSVVSQALIIGNTGSAVDATTISNGFAALSFVGTIIASDAAVAINGQASGQGNLNSPVGNLLLSFVSDFIIATGQDATGILITSPNHAAAALAVQDTALTVTGSHATGISLVASGSTSFVKIAALIYDSTITVNGGSTTALTLNNAMKGVIALQLEGNHINSDGDGIVAVTKNNASASLGVGDAEGNTFNVAGQNISLTTQNTSFMTVGILNNTMNSGTAGVLLNEGAGSELDATVTGNNITLSNPGGMGISFDQGGLTEQVLIAHNTLNGTNGISVDRMGTDTAFKAVIKGNTVMGSSGNGISIAADGANFKTTLTDNILIGSAHNGININGSAGILQANIGNNTITDTTNIGISFSAATATIKVNPGSSPLDDNTVLGSGSLILKGNSHTSGSIEINGTTYLSFPITVSP